MSKQISNKQIIALLIVVLVIAVAAATLLSRDDDPQPLQDGAAMREAALASEHSPTLGNVNAKVHIVEFLDPACETCALFFPLHTGSDYAVKVLEASRKQDKYWETLEALLASQREWTQHHTVLPDKIGPAIAGVGLDMDQLMADMNSVEVMVRMEKDKKDAILLKVSKTPDYYVNGRPLPSFGQRQLAQLIGEELGK
jgi:protein-disulfide isomerase